MFLNYSVNWRKRWGNPFEGYVEEILLGFLERWEFFHQPIARLQNEAMASNDDVSCFRSQLVLRQFLDDLDSFQKD